MTELAPNAGKVLETVIDGVAYLRLPVRTRLIQPRENLTSLIEEYVAPHLQEGDLLFVSEKVVCVTQGRLIRRDAIKTSWLARLLSKQVRNHVGTPEFRGLGHGTAPAMQLVIDEAGYIRVILAALAAAITRPFGLKGAFYLLIGRQAKSIDCPMSWTLEPYTEYAKQAPFEPDRVAREIRDRFGAETVIIDANYRGAFSLGVSSRIPERLIQALVKDNPAGQDSEMTPFLIIRKRNS